MASHSHVLVYHGHICTKPATALPMKYWLKHAEALYFPNVSIHIGIMYGIFNIYLHVVDAYGKCRWMY